MARHREKTIAGKTFENILFLAEVFGDKADELELARCFELSHPRVARVVRRRHKAWPLWN